jgi:hypothetical protein
MATIKQRLQFLCYTKWPVIIWFLVAILDGLAQVLRGKDAINNYLIFKHVFTHTIQQVNLYATYPLLYNDSNHYGPVFSLIIAPFALLPNIIAIPLWNFFNAFLLYKAIKLLPLKKHMHHAILLICIIEMSTAAHSLQFNASVAACIIAAYAFTKNNKTIWATFCIMLGFYVKLYGIVGLVFWLFSKQKLQFVGYSVLWAVVFFILPMAIANPSFIVQCYYDWYASLQQKNTLNQALAAGNMQDISVMGMVKRIFGLPNLSNLIVLAPALLVYLFSLLQFKQYKNTIYQLLLLAQTLLFVVCFSTGSESPTFIIALAGVAIWFVVLPSPKQVWHWCVLAFVFVFTCLVATDVVPYYIKITFIRPYALKVLPCFVVWLIIVYTMINFKFAHYKSVTALNEKNIGSNTHI